MTILMTMMTVKVLVLTISGETSGEMSRHDGTHTWGLGLWVNSAILVHGKYGRPNGYRTILMYITHRRRPSRHCSSSMEGRLLEPTMSGPKWSSLSWFTVALALSVNTLWVWCCSWGGEEEEDKLFCFFSFFSDVCALHSLESSFGYYSEWNKCSDKAVITFLFHGCFLVIAFWTFWAIYFTFAWSDLYILLHPFLHPFGWWVLFPFDHRQFDQLVTNQSSPLSVWWCLRWW